MLDKDLIPKIHQVKAELCKRNFFYFVQEFWHVIIPEEPVYNWHIEYLCRELQKMVELVRYRKPKEYDLIINIPPGTSKSTIATVMLPAWAWTIDDSIRTLTASYSASLSTDHAIKSRDIIKSDKYRLYFPKIAIKSDQDNKTHYKNESGGERYATSVTGTVTGFHAHLIVVDDPLNPKGASSDAERETANSFMDVTLSTRKVSKSVTPTILVMQRLHELDCTGNWLEKKGKKIKHICLPGELSKDVKPIELKEKYIDGLLDIKRLTINDLQELRINLGSYGYSGQIMQTPSPLDGGIWKKTIIPIDDKDIDLLIPKMQSFGTDWDLAYTEKQANSASAFVTAGKYENKMYIDNLGFDWLEFPALINYMKAKKAPHYIEAKASGKSAKQTLTNRGIPAVEVKVDGGDKIARATLATPYAESGMIYCRRSLLNKLYNDDKQGILVFPNGKGDDLQDALVQSINRLLGKRQFFVI
jgi:predicted phage terminase large subunit-like protein